MPNLKVKANTVIKTKPVDSSELRSDEKLSLPQGEYPIVEYEDRGKHLLVTFETPLSGKKQWYVFEGHIDLLSLEPYPENTDRPPEDKTLGKLRLPGLDNLVSLADPIISNGNFSWREATKNGTRIPLDAAITKNIVLMAEKMEKVRRLFDNRSIVVTSWYRDPTTNRNIGGARNSTHMLGYAVDFNVDGFNPKQVQQKLENYWNGGMGYGRTFTHLDCRNYKARWNYGS